MNRYESHTDGGIMEAIIMIAMMAVVVFISVIERLPVP